MRSDDRRAETYRPVTLSLSHAAVIWVLRVTPFMHLYHSLRVQMFCHDYPLGGNSERLVGLGSHDKLILAEESFKFTSVVAPPCTIERLRHDLKHNNVVALDRAATVPKALGWRTGIRGQSAKGLGQHVSDRIVMVVWKGMSCIVADREKNLYEMGHRKTRPTRKLTVHG
jgi:hypothetical protein